VHDDDLLPHLLQPQGHAVIVLYHDGADQPLEHVQHRGAVVVRVVPVRSGRVVGRDLDHMLLLLARVHLQEDVVAEP